MVSSPSPTDDGLSAFENARPRLFGVVYRILGSVTEAEDVIQDVWTRWQSTDRSVVRDPQAFLTTTATRLAINVLQSARTRRETYVGPWLPEPVDTSADPGLGAERGEALELAVLLLLERLSPTERAAYMLREAFNCPYREIGEILRLEEANARQLVTRARQHVTDGRRARVSDAEQKRLLHAFIAASRSGDIAGFARIVARSEARPSRDARRCHIATSCPVFTDTGAPRRRGSQAIDEALDPRSANGKEGTTWEPRFLAHAN